MAISQTTRKALYKRAGGRCECRMNICSHHSAGQRCPRSLVSKDWKAHHRIAGFDDNLNNLTAMCATCHNNTRIYGKVRD
jgi:hypothetical protein